MYLLLYFLVLYIIVKVRGKIFTKWLKKSLRNPEITSSKVSNFEHCYIPISGFLASRASSVVNSVFGKRMKILDLQKKKKKADEPLENKLDLVKAKGLFITVIFSLPTCFQFRVWGFIGLKAKVLPVLTWYMSSAAQRFKASPARCFTS